MQPVSFVSRPLPVRLDHRLRERLARGHRTEPFNPGDSRAAVRRVVQLGADLDAAAQVFRGGLDLRGHEVDHVWVSFDGVVVDAAYPLHDPAFVEVLRRFVAGEIEAGALDEAADGSDITDRVLGVFPEPVRYIGRPVWSERRR